MSPLGPLFVLVLVGLVHSDNVNVNKSKEVDSLRNGRKMPMYLGLVSCAMQSDVGCFLDVAGGVLEEQRTSLLAQADSEALQATGRSDDDSKPSYLANSLTKMFSELANMFRNGFPDIIRASRQVFTEDDDEEDDEDNAVASKSNGARAFTKKKKKKPLKNLIHLIKVAIISIIIIFKLGIVLKVLQTAMQFKFLLISLGGFALQAAKVWMSFRDKKNHHEEIVYKNPYGDNDFASPGGAPYGGEYNGRSAQEAAYAAQR